MNADSRVLTRVRLPPSFQTLHGLGNRGGADAPGIPCRRADRFSGLRLRFIFREERLEPPLEQRASLTGREPGFAIDCRPDREPASTTARRDGRHGNGQTLKIGEERGLVEAAVILLEAKRGRLTKSLRQRLQTLGAKQLRQLLADAIPWESLDPLGAWLAAHGK